ncbi:MAG: hypothetical protein R3F19_15260 [Verrucomicrobiales bacterium]
MWLNDLCLTATGESYEKFFSSVVVNDDAQETLISTFFGKADACLVRRDFYLTAVELNTQIEARLEPVASSPGYPLFFVGMRRSVPEGLKQFFMADDTVDPKQPEWRHAFEMLRVRRINLTTPEDFKSLRELVERSDTRSAPSGILGKTATTSILDGK